jgi:hypothetical protein
MANAKSIQKAIDRVTDLKAQLKEANADLKAELEETSLFKAILSATMDQSSEKTKVPEKVAAAQAFKVTLAVYSKKEEADAE